MAMQRPSDPARFSAHVALLVLLHGRLLRSSSLAINVPSAAREDEPYVLTTLICANTIVSMPLFDVWRLTQGGRFLSSTNGLFDYTNRTGGNMTIEVDVTHLPMLDIGTG